MLWFLKIRPLWKLSVVYARCLNQLWDWLKVKAFIHFVTRSISSGLQWVGGCRVHWSCRRARHELHPVQVASPSQPHMLTRIPTATLEKQVNLTSVSLNCARKPEHLEETHAGTARTRKLHTKSPTNREIETQNVLAIIFYHCCNMLALCNIYSCKQVVLFCVLHFQNLHLLCVQLYEQQTAGMEYFLSLVK